MESKGFETMRNRMKGKEIKSDPYFFDFWLFKTI